MLLSEPVNPGGYASYGLVILKDGKEIFKQGRLVAQGKEASNNVAEYSGLLAALLWLYKNNLQDAKIVVRADSKLVIYQMSVDPSIGRKWAMNKGLYIPIAMRCREGLKRFSNITFEWIPREENYLADELSKSVLKKMNVKFRIQPE